MSTFPFSNLLDKTKSLCATVQGWVAHDAAASGNPVQVGGVYRATDPAVADGDMASLRVNAKGEAIVALSGSIVENQKNKVTAVATDIMTDYTAPKTMETTLLVSTNTAGILSLECDGVLGTLNGGIALDTGKWYSFDIPMVAALVYNLQFSAIATMQIKWIGGF